ncbi:M15 family metallopeptidase [uncultured Akkermansia sp.]|nr:M15 family metallopeptidase [uncultured Akkermansia sp.]
MKTCVAAACGMFLLLVSCSGSREFKPAFNQPLQPVMQPGFVYVDQVAPLVKTDLKYAGYDNFVGRPLDGYHGRRAILRIQAAQALKKSRKICTGRVTCWKLMTPTVPIPLCWTFANGVLTAGTKR